MSKKRRPSGNIAGLLEFFIFPGVGFAYLGFPAPALSFFAANLFLIAAIPFLVWFVPIIVGARLVSAVWAGRVGKALAAAEVDASELPSARLVKFGVTPKTLAVFLAVVAVAFTAAAREMWVQAFKLPSGAMMPTLAIGDHIMVHKGAYWLSPPSRGDVVTFHEPCGSGKVYIKRVVAVAGDRVAYACNSLFLNGRRVPSKPAGSLELRDYDPRIGFSDPRTVELVDETIEGHTHQLALEPGSEFAIPFPEQGRKPACPGAQPIGTIEPRVSSDKCEPPSEYVVPSDHVFVMGDSRNNSHDSRIFGPVAVDSVIGKATSIWWSKPPQGGAAWGRIGSVR